MAKRNLKRKAPPDEEGAIKEVASNKRPSPGPEAEMNNEGPENENESHDIQSAQGTQVTNKITTMEDAKSQAQLDRQARFKALQARQSQSKIQNRKETAAESQRLATDHGALKTLERRSAIASHKLMQAEANEDGEDFERKRAWDWTIDESEKWDRRMAKKERNRQNVAFQDYRQDAKKVYKRQMHDFGTPDMEAYEKEKNAAIERAAENGTLEIVETEEGELVAVDRDGTFYAGANSTEYGQNKPDKAAVDRLVEGLRKAEEVRLRRRRERKGAEDESDISYINEKNKQFNSKLRRFYDKYTTEIRDNFERGTAI